MGGDSPDRLTRLVDWWRAEEIRLNPPASDDALDAFAGKHNIALPAGFQKLYRLADGMADHDHDMNFFRWWPLEEVDRGTETPFVDEDEIVRLPFGDWMIHSFVYCIRYSAWQPEPMVEVVGDSGSVPPSSLEEFAELLMSLNPNFPGT